MSIDVVRGTNQKPVSSDALVSLLSSDASFSGQLFVGYPIIGTSEGPHILDALLISEDRGVIVFHLVEGTDVQRYDLLQDDSVNKLESKLRLHPQLLDRRQLRIPIHSITFAPGINNISTHAEPEYPLANMHNLLEVSKGFNWSEPKQSVYNATLSVIENISTIRHGRSRRSILCDSSRGGKLKRLEESIATLDNMQIKAVIETVEGVQRIRGLAGSGKTIVLALKAAYLHAQHPEWRIAVTFNTRSLKGQFRRLITNFTLEQAKQEPDWESLSILNAWGAPGGAEREGMYYQFCRRHNISYMDFQTARSTVGTVDTFSHVCQRAIDQVTESEPFYDTILVDEAQDFSPAFLRLCHMSLKAPQRLVYAYDELQSLTEQSLPSPDMIFEQSTSIADVILAKCYRNSRPVLVTAHALGFGIYREPPTGTQTGLIQMFDNANLWTDVGYEVTDGALGDGSNVTLQRSFETSPEFLEAHSELDDLVRFQCFQNAEEQASWVAEAIRINLTDDELKHDDIIVINPDPQSTRKKVGLIRSKLWDLGINSHLAGVDTEADVFFDDAESITFTGVFRAKGNEAGMVYIINAQDCHSGAFNLGTIRNQLFTAITRSKAWIRVTGVGQRMLELTREFQSLKEHDFRLHFTYPDTEQRQRLRLVHRDMSVTERHDLQAGQRNLAQLTQGLESGRLNPADLDENMVAKLRELLGDT